MTNTLATDFALSNCWLQLTSLFTSWLNRSRLGPRIIPLLPEGDVARHYPGPRLALLGSWGAFLLMLTACQRTPTIPPRKIVIQQSWALNPGDFVAGHLITGGLGDITLDVANAKLAAPFAGKVELAADGARCIYFSTPEIPAYLFRYCGIQHPQVGNVDAGQVFGRGQHIHFATLRRQPDGTWAIVEPSNQVLEKTLGPSRRHSFFSGPGF